MLLYLKLSLLFEKKIKLKKNTHFPKTSKEKTQVFVESRIYIIKLKSRLKIYLHNDFLISG